jgi:hypothetical protein
MADTLALSAFLKSVIKKESPTFMFSKGYVVRSSKKTSAGAFSIKYIWTPQIDVGRR